MPKWTLTFERKVSSRFSDANSLALVSATLAALSVTLYLPIMPLISEECEISIATIQYSVGAFIIGQAILPIILGFFADSYPAPRVFIFIMIGFCLSCLLSIFSLSWWSLFMLRMLQGGFSQSGVTISRAMVREEVSFGKCVQTFSLIGTVQSAIHLVGPFACGVALIYFSWKFVFYVLFLIGALGFLGALLNLKKTASTHILVKDSKFSFKTISSRSFVFLSLIVSTLHLSSIFFFTFAPFYFMDFKKYSAEIFGIYFGITSLGFLLGSVFAARYLHSKDPAKSVRAGILLCFISGALLFIPEFTNGIQIKILIASQFIYSFIKAVISPIIQTQALSLSQNNKAITSAGFNFISTITAPLGAIFAGWVCIENSITFLGFLICGLSIIDFYLYLYVIKKNVYPKL